MSYSSSKKKLQYTDNWRENDMMIYFDIGYKSATQQIDNWFKDTKDEEATLI